MEGWEEGGGRRGWSIRFLHQTEKAPHCPIKHTAQWYILPAAAAIRGAGNSTILWASAASQLMSELTTEAAAIVQREEVLICKHGRVILIPGRQDAISGPAGGGCSPHLPCKWLFQHCSSSGSTTLAELQMLSGRLDQKRFDSPSFPMTSTTCSRNQRDMKYHLGRPDDGMDKKKKRKKKSPIKQASL